MTKKDYELAAHEINGSLLQDGETLNRDAVIEIFCKVFSQDNDRFNADKFKEACLTGKHIRKSIKGVC